MAEISERTNSTNNTDKVQDPEKDTLIESQESDLNYSLEEGAEKPKTKVHMTEQDTLSHEQMYDPGLHLKEELNIRQLIEDHEAGFEVDCREEVEEVHAYRPQEVYGHLRDMDLEAGVGEFGELKKNMKEDLSGDGGVMKQVLKFGNGQKVPRGYTVTIHYNAYLEFSAEPYDSSRIRNKPQHFTLVKDYDDPAEGFAVIPGLDLAVASMEKNELSRFLISPEYAYGPLGVPPRIPADSTLMFEVEVMYFRDMNGLEEFYSTSAAERKELPFDRIKKVYAQQRELGKAKFKDGRFEEALRCFLQCKRLMDETTLKDEEEENEMKKHWMIAVKNLLVCALKVKQFSRILSISSEALRIYGKDSKVLYAKGKAFHHMGEFDRGKKCLLEAQKLDPDSSDIVRELKALEITRAKHKATEKLLYKKMFQFEKNPATAAEKNAEEKEQTQQDDDDDDDDGDSQDIEGIKELCSCQALDDFKSKFLKLMESYWSEEVSKPALVLPYHMMPEGAKDYMVEHAQMMGLTAVPTKSDTGEEILRVEKPPI